MSTFVGYVGVCLAVFCFGSNFIVTKRFETGDGFFFQLPFACGIWTAGLCVALERYVSEGHHRFYITAMIGGFIWETGNILCVPIIQRIGMAPGLIIWGISALFTGWATGYFGLFGLKRDEIDTLWLNVTGLGFAAMSLLAAFKVKKVRTANDLATRDDFSTVDDDDDGGSAVGLHAANLQDSFGGMIRESRPSSLMSLIDNGSDTETETNDAIESPKSMGASARAAKHARRRHYEGVIMAMIAGVFFGSNFDPVTWIKDHDQNASLSSLDYVFSHFCGILVTSLLYFMLYCAMKANKPWVNAELLLPAYASGLCWAVAQIGWFLANGSLGYTTAFPLVLIGPGFVGALWDVVVFKEIRGRTNMAWLGLVFLLIAASATCTVVSRSD